jgi:hypothetical protein
MKLTQSVANTLAIPPGKREAIFFDDDLPGFGLRLRATGSRSWVFQYEVGTKQRRMTLSTAGVITLAIARKWAREMYARVKLGGDPAAGTAAARDLEQQIARKMVEFAKNGIEPACYLYRHYDMSGDLIYVGITLAPLDRTKRHAAAEWGRLILKILIEPFATREEALDAEERAIREEFPRFNKTHNRRRHPANELQRVTARRVAMLARDHV